MNNTILEVEGDETNPFTALNLFPAWLEKMRTAGAAVDTTIPALNRAIGGLAGLVIMGGPPGCGKTALAVQIAIGHAKQGGGVIYCGYEEGPAGFFSKLMQRETGISRKDQATALREGWNRDSGADVARAVEGEIQALGNRLQIFGLPPAGEGIDREAIQEGAQVFRHTTGLPALVVVDSLHYTPLPGGAATDKGAIDAALRTWSEIQQATGATVLMIGHQTKAEARGADSGLMAFSGSATIAYAVDMAIQLQRKKDETGKDEIPDAGGRVTLEISVPKNRMGGVYTRPIETSFHLFTQKIKDK
jgi:replicative DNA helicase